MRPKKNPKNFSKAEYCCRQVCAIGAPFCKCNLPRPKTRKIRLGCADPIFGPQRFRTTFSHISCVAFGPPKNLFGGENSAFAHPFSRVPVNRANIRDRCLGVALRKYTGDTPSCCQTHSFIVFSAVVVRSSVAQFALRNTPSWAAPAIAIFREAVMWKMPSLSLEPTEWGRY